MGEQQKKINGWRLGILGGLTAVCCLMMAVGFCLLDFQRIGIQTVGSLKPLENGDSAIYWTQDGIRSNSFSSQRGNTFYIDTPGQLAYMNYLLTRVGADESSTENYEGYSFVLNNHIKLSDHDSNLGSKKTPLWTPIDIGTNGKNHNITFNGNGNTIEGLHISINGNTTQQVGFFAEMIGGVFENVTFKNPIIDYVYTAESIKADDPLRPDAPIDICVGMIAGTANTTYINNVTIVNPTINLITDNVNGHNFYVGTAVGKLTFTSTSEKEENGNEVIKTPNTVTPKKWGLDSIKVVKESGSTSTGVTMTVNAGTNANLTYGEATNGYLGGLVGINISSKIINSSLIDYAINPQINASSGAYSVGGLAGMTTQIAADQKLLVAAGLYNNLLSNVTIGGNIQADTTCYTGKLAGRVYSGGWIYNNVVFGAMNNLNLWGEIFNSRTYIVADNCIGHINGGVHEYFLKGENGTYSNCSATTDTIVSSGEVYPRCAANGHMDSYLFAEDDHCTANEMEKYNFCFNSTNDEAYKDPKEGFINKDVNITVTDNDAQTSKVETYKKYTLLNNYNYEEGFLFHAALPIVKYELGLTVNEKNPDDPTKPIEDYEKRLDAVYQFKLWALDSGKNNELYLDGYIGADYSIVFEANSDNTNPLSNAYWLTLNEYGYYDEITELEIGRTYQQIIYAPDTPECEGYKFLGWKISGLTAKEIESYKTLGLYDDAEHYIFGKERIDKAGRRFYADWELQDYKVTFMLDDNTPFVKNNEAYTETRAFNQPVRGPGTLPVSESGYSCIGWYLKENLPANGEDADPDKCWVFWGSSNPTLMPGRNIVLYPGWINNFTNLSRLLDDSTYIDYYKNCYIYFRENEGKAFNDAYTAAFNARKADNRSNTDQLLNNLQNAFANLRVDPKKLLTLPAFDETLIENSCPLLFAYETRLNYNTFKDTIRKYVTESEQPDNDEVLKDIDRYAKNYDRLTTLFNSLRGNLNPSVAAVGGIDSAEVQKIIKKYRDLQNRNSAVVKSRYDTDSITVLENAQFNAERLWEGEGDDYNIKDFQLAVDAYENALNNLKPKIVTIGNNGNNGGSSVPQMSISPVLLGVIIVLVLMAGAGGYIGIDFALSKRRGAQKTANTNVAADQPTEAPEPEEEETYI